VSILHPRWPAAGFAIGLLAILATGCAVSGGGYYGGDWPGYYEPAGAYYGGWGPGYLVGPVYGGGYRGGYGGGRGGFSGGRGGFSGGQHAFRAAPASRMAPSIPGARGGGFGGGARGGGGRGGGGGGRGGGGGGGGGGRR
jgi:hypothetical protein